MSKEIEPFSGFPKETFAFLRALEKNNNKKWFDANRDRYQEHVVGPAKSFVVAMGAEMQKSISKSIVANPSGNSGSLGRINRVIRFSKDKTPYNTHLQFTFWEEPGTKKTSPGFMVWVSAKGVGYGAGKYGLDKNELATFRDAVDKDKSGKALVAAIKKATRGGASLNSPHYKKVPKGFDAEHPRADLLRYSDIFVHHREDHPKSIGSKSFAKWCTTRLAKMAPLQQWLKAALK